MRLRHHAVVLAASLAAVLLAVPTAPAFAWTAPKDPDFSKQYGPEQLGAMDAWTKSTGKGVTVAVIDSGVDVDHPEMKGKLVVLPGSDFADGDNNPDDDSGLKDGAGKQVRGHGTGGAGVIGAITNNDVGMAGMAPDVKIMPLKVFPSNSNASTVNLLASVPQAIKFAVDNGAKVINLSLGTFSFGTLIGFIETPCTDALNRGSLCVVSSGNGRSQNPNSGYTRDLNALLVTANDRDARPASFAQNADTKWGVSAPGVQVFTTATLEQEGYQTVSGTSFSAPHASGAAALLFAQGLNVQQVIKKMLDTAISMGDPTRNGAGLVDAAAATGAPRTQNEAATQSTSPSSSGSVLLPKAATRTTVARTPSGAPAPTNAPVVGGQPATGKPGAGSPAAPANTDPDFAADLASRQDDEEGVATGPPKAADTDQIAFFTAVTVAGILVLGTGLSTMSQFRRRRLARSS